MTDLYARNEIDFQKARAPLEELAAAPAEKSASGR